jgi:hypothetical protein
MAVTARALAYCQAGRAGRSMASIAGRSVGYPPAFAAGRVRLKGAVPFRAPFLPQYDDEGELRAASAEIMQLHILAASVDPNLGELLYQRYRVPVYV